MLQRYPFWDRAAFLGGLMVVAAAFDLWRYGKAATRYKEYSFIWFTGLLGGIVGGIADLATSSISPDYFTLGKGLSGGEGFLLRAVMFGIREGISAGVIAGAISVYVSRKKSRFGPLGFGELLGLLWMPAACAVAGGLALPLVAGHSDPAELIFKLAGDLSPAQTARFLRVWWIHIGLYGGLLAGLIWLIWVVGKRRRGAA
jgi:hypothetical protein